MRPNLALGGDRVHAVAQQSPGTSWTIHHRLVAPTDGGPHVDRCLSDPAVDAVEPDLAAAGRFVLATWRTTSAHDRRTSESIVAVASSDGGLRFGAPSLLARVADRIVAPVAAAMEEGNGWIAWVEAAPDGRDQVRLAATHDFGSSWSTATLTDPTIVHAGYLRLAAGGRDPATGGARVVVAFVARIAGAGELESAVVACASIDGGATFPPERTLRFGVDAATPSRPCELALATDARGTIALAWVDAERDREQVGIWAQRNDAFGGADAWLGGATPAATRIDVPAPTRDAAYEPAVAVAADGACHVLFTAIARRAVAPRRPRIDLVARSLARGASRWNPEQVVASEEVESAAAIVLQMPVVATTRDAARPVAAVAWCRPDPAGGSSIALAHLDGVDLPWRTKLLAPASEDERVSGRFPALLLVAAPREIVAQLAWDGPRADGVTEARWLEVALR